MGFFESFMATTPHPHSRDTPNLPEFSNNVQDSGQIFVFGRADSGKRVDEKSALQIATVYACVRLISETIAGLPLHLYRITDDSGNGKEKARDGCFSSHMKSAGTTTPQCCELSFYYFIVLFTGCSSPMRPGLVYHFKESQDNAADSVGLIPCIEYQMQCLISTPSVSSFCLPLHFAASAREGGEFFAGGEKICGGGRKREKTKYYVNHYANVNAWQSPRQVENTSTVWGFFCFSLVISIYRICDSTFRLDALEAVLP